jgi:hypothetical protein
MQNELYHHGVEGMSWGKRNGPPYPLNASGKAKLRAQKKAAKIGSTEGTSDLRAQKKAAKAENKKLALEVKKSQVYKNNKMMNQMRAKKRVHRDTAIGGLASAAVGFAAGGPVGAAAGIIGGALVSSIASSTINKGRQIYENSKFKNMKVSELKEKKVAKNDTSESGLLSKKKTKEQPVKSYKKLEETEIKAAKEDAIRKGNIKEAYKNREHYTDDELKKVKARYELNIDVKEILDADKRRGAEKVDAIADQLETINKLGNAVAVGAANIIKIYNAVGPFVSKANGNKKFEQIPTDKLAQYQSPGKNKKKK